MRLTTVPSARTAVVVHVYYPDVWPLIRARLQQLTHIPFDLFVSVALQHQSLGESVTEDFTKATVLMIPNRGRDAAPFLQIASEADRLGYEFVLKLHTKKSVHRPSEHRWFEDILANLVPDEPAVCSQIMETLERADTGLIGPCGQYFTLPVNYDANRSHVRQVLSSACSIQEARRLHKHRWDYGFFAGSMFWARLEAIRPILRQGLVMVFEPEKRQVDGTLAHGLERAYSLVPELNGRAMYEVSESGIQRTEYRTVNIPDWLDDVPGSASVANPAAHDHAADPAVREHLASRLLSAALKDTDARLTRARRERAQLEIKNQALVQDRAERHRLEAQLERQDSLIEEYRRSRAVRVATTFGQVKTSLRNILETRRTARRDR